MCLEGGTLVQLNQSLFGYLPICLSDAQAVADLFESVSVAVKGFV